MLRTLLIIRIAVTLNVTLIQWNWCRYHESNVTLTPAPVTLTLANVTFGIQTEPATRVTLVTVRTLVRAVTQCDHLRAERAFYAQRLRAPSVVQSTDGG